MQGDFVSQDKNSGESKPLLELLYEIYTEYNGIENGYIRDKYRELREQYAHLSDREFDVLFDRVGSLCCAHERAAFLEGVRVGARLLAELYRK